MATNRPASVSDPSARLDTSRCPVPAWLPGGHGQTLYGAFCAQHPSIHFIRERVDTPDGDFVDLDWCGPGLDPHTRPDGQATPHESGLVGTAASRWIDPADWPQLPADARALILFHGLEGSSLSPYMQAIAHTFRRLGWVVVAAHFRSCSGVPNRMARAYYSGDSTEIAFMLDHVRSRLPQASWHAAGISLGGNALLKHLGETGHGIQGLRAAAAVSVPMNLAACGRRLSDTVWGRQLYSRYFLHSIRRKIYGKAHEFPGSVDVLRTQRMRSLREFDDLYTAPMHGYQNALDYWTRAASLPLLPDIRIPTLILNARNDPFVPEASLPGSRDASADVLLHQPGQGGHASFVTGIFPGHLGWLPNRLRQFFETGQ
ncbi:YheT family hydrolase [Castellaniella sp.]|uniref:YheT family hydrolase n=1 Tax=Castellaniella sp. TaxID=1955812 RepID=UPI002AFE03EF|nr:alpha/beta fold hydrolase [Castellaniella sp.]